jgi:hypothetical protein
MLIKDSQVGKVILNGSLVSALSNPAKNHGFSELADEN